MTDRELINRVETHAKGFDGWKKDEKYDIWVRSNEIIPNVFDDKVYSFQTDANAVPQFKMVCTGTSHTGTYGLKNFKEWNSLGTAILEANRFVEHSHRYGFHKGKPAYVQAKPFPFYRDGDMDNIPEEIGQLFTDAIIGANCHRAGQHSTRIDNWSVGCLVRNIEAIFVTWLSYMNKRPLSVAILEEW